MRPRSALYPLLAFGLCLAPLGCAYQPVAKSAPAAAVSAGPSPAARAALEEAETVLAEVKKAGHEWRVIDKATGADSETLTKLLEKGKELGARGLNDEAIRIATRVKEMARLGLRQAAENTNAGPHYPR